MMAAEAFGGRKTGWGRLGHIGCSGGSCGASCNGYDGGCCCDNGCLLDVGGLELRGLGGAGVGIGGESGLWGSYWNHGLRYD